MLKLAGQNVRQVGVKKFQRVTRPIQLLALVFLVIPAKQEMKTLALHLEVHHYLIKTVARGSTRRVEQQGGALARPSQFAKVNTA